MRGLQIIGSLLAIPVGLGSAYSIYHANFTTEARCESLRTSIVSMLDKSADASTLRMLMRRDVTAFETNCGSVDPDAVAAFKNLLASGAVAKPKPKPEPQVQPQQQTQAPPPAATDTKSARQEIAKPPRREIGAPAARDADAKPAAREQTASDAEWLEAVRGALVHAPAATTEAKESIAAPTPAEPPRLLGKLHAPAAADAPAVSAPALAPATPVAATPAPATEDDHPVPPGSIPDAAPQVTAAVPAEKPERSRIKALIADIPLLGRMVDR